MATDADVRQSTMGGRRIASIAAADVPRLRFLFEIRHRHQRASEFSIRSVQKLQRRSVS